MPIVLACNTMNTDTQWNQIMDMMKDMKDNILGYTTDWIVSMHSLYIAYYEYLVLL